MKGVTILFKVLEAHPLVEHIVSQSIYCVYLIAFYDLAVRCTSQFALIVDVVRQ